MFKSFADHLSGDLEIEENVALANGNSAVSKDWDGLNAEVFVDSHVI